MSDPQSFFKSLNSPRFVCAPMVNGSELPFRLLVRKYGVQLAYSPMLNAKAFIKNKNYCREAFTTCPEDRPLFVQFCANDPDILLQAARLVEDKCDAIDLNFGCPQGIAKRGNYGAFLLENVPLICSLISILKNNLKIPVTCKIRILSSVEDTLKLAKSIEKAGCYILTVHGRTKEQNKQQVGSADQDVIKLLKKELYIPVILNGNIESLEDAKRALRYTGVDSVMSAEGILSRPNLFSSTNNSLSPITIAEQYLDLVKKYPSDVGIVQGHLFKILQKSLCVHTSIRDFLAKCKDLNEILQIPYLIKAADKKFDDEGSLIKKYEALPSWYKRHLRQKEVKPLSIIKHNEMIVPDLESVFG